jgi:NAD(P)-dependent dehydrogenase (short-subunit alcohol dehydrogenase family)
LLFASEGANVLLVDINLAAAQKGAKLISERYPNVRALAIGGDVGKEADVKNAVDKAVQEFGRLDVMVLLKPSRTASGSSPQPPFAV